MGVLFLFLFLFCFCFCFCCFVCFCFELLVWFGLSCCCCYVRWLDCLLFWSAVLFAVLINSIALCSVVQLNCTSLHAKCSFLASWLQPKSLCLQPSKCPRAQLERV